MTSTMLLRTSLSRTNIEWHNWCHQTMHAQWSRQAAILVNKPRTESGTSQMGNNIFALCIRAGNWGWWRLFMWHNLDRARTNIPRGSYGESGWLSACCNRVWGVVSQSPQATPASPSTIALHQHGQIPQSISARSGDGKGTPGYWATAMSSTQQQEPVPASTLSHQPWPCTHTQRH